MLQQEQPFDDQVERPLKWHSSKGSFKELLLNKKSWIKKVQRTYKMIILIAMRTQILLLSNQVWLCSLSDVPEKRSLSTLKMCSSSCRDDQSNEVTEADRKWIFSWLKLNLSQRVTLIRKMNHNVAVAGFELPDSAAAWGDLQGCWCTCSSSWCRSWRWGWRVAGTSWSARGGW